MSYPTELRTYINEEDILDEDYVYRLYIKKLKEVENMNELIAQLKEQRDHYVAEVERLKARDINVLINERFEMKKEQIADEVRAECDAELVEAELKVKHYDFVIEKQEEMLVENVENECENMEA